MWPGHDGPGYEHWPHSEDRSGIPYDDELTAELVDHAIEVLATARSPLGPSDPAVWLSCLVSLQAEAEGRKEEAVALAYEAGYDWGEIAVRTAVFPVEEVAERFEPYVAWRAAGRPLPVAPANPNPDGGPSLR